MKKILILIFLICSVQLFAATTYHFKVNGSDTTGNGSIGTPYRSLYKCSQVAKSVGDSIIAGEGTFLESHNCLIAVGVSVRGQGILLTTIKGTYTIAAAIGMTTATMTLSSPNVGTNGNQSISYLTLDGVNWTGCNAIGVKNRSHVKIHDVKIINFNYGGVTFNSTYANLTTTPPIFETGNQIYNSTITNCGSTHGTNGGNGLIYITCQDSMVIHDNTLDARGRITSQNGNIINAGGMHFKHFRYYKNTSYKPDWNNDWNFHLEFWLMEGPFEIDSNYFYGGENPINIGGAIANTVSIHNNYFQPITGNGTASGKKHSRVAIVIESFNTDNVTVYNNHFKNWYAAISVGDAPYTVCTMSNISIHHNLMENIVYDGVVFYLPGTISLQVERVGNTLTDVYIYNNTMVTDNIIKISGINIAIGGSNVNTPIAGGTATNINIKNNIMVNFKNHGPYQFMNNGVINGLHIENNLCYNTANFNVAVYWWPYQNGTLTNGTYTFTNNIPTSNTTQQLSLFVSSTDFNLQTSSPCRNTGQDVGLTSDLAGRSIPQESVPDIGAYEYYVYNPWVLGTVTLDAPINVTSRTILLNATAVLDGGGTISERGICYSTSVNPTTADTKISVGSGLGTFSTTIKNLNPHTTYHFRSYCINEAGTAYSDDVAIMTAYSSTINYNGKTLSYNGKSFKY